MSHTSTEALRTTTVEDHTGSKFDRSACGAKRIVRAAARWEIAGVAKPPATVAPAPAMAFSTVLRCSMDTPQVRSGNDPPQAVPAQRGSGGTSHRKPAMTYKSIPA